MRFLTVPVAAAICLPGCATPQICAPGPTQAGALRCAAAAGDRQAMVELGRLYETGNGVEVDPSRAAQLYQQAARATPHTMFVYSPPVGRESVGQVIPVRTGASDPGLPEAQYRLAMLHLAGNGLPVDEARAKALLEQAANAGYAPAVSELQNLHGQAARRRQ